MFNIFKKKKEEFEEIVSPLEGVVIPLNQIPDPVFAEKMMGDGIGIIPTEGKLCSPVDGEVVQVFETKHAIILKSNNGTDILIHVGLETVSLDGVPFDVKVEQGQKIKKSQLLMEVDLEYIKSNGLQIVTPVILVNDPDKEQKEIIEKALPSALNIGECLMKIK
ncbi:MAG: PTS glucose transporter subunit IIA [Clostridium sp.]